jgi:hypothetical protein
VDDDGSAAVADGDGVSDGVGETVAQGVTDGVETAALVAAGAAEVCGEGVDSGSSPLPGVSS